MKKGLMRKILLGVCSVLSLACVTGSVVGLSVPAKADEQGQSENYGELLYTFQVMSDMEIDGSANGTTVKNFEKALQAVKANAPNSSAIIMPGDVTSNGYATEWTKWSDIITNVGGLPNVYPTLGNHDLTASNPTSYNTLYQNFLNGNGGVTNNTYYDEWIGGNHFIMLGSEATGHNVPYYSDAQFDWFETKLAEQASYDKPIFVFSHYTFRDTTAGSYLGSQIGHSMGSEDKVRFMEILKEYPQVIWFTGHTHFALTDPNNFYNIDLENGNGADIIGDSSTHYLCIGDYSANTGSQFLFVEVYENAVKVRGYDNQNEKFLDNAVKVIDKKSKTPTTTPSPKIELLVESISEEQPNVTAYVTYENAARVSADDGAWVGVVSSASEGVRGNVYRYAMLKDLQRDGNGRYIWEMSDDSSCGDGVLEAWDELIAENGKLYVGLFEDTLYLGQDPDPNNSAYGDYQYDPYARIAKAVVKVAGGIEMQGSGTEADPYLITDATVFTSFLENIRTGKDNYQGKYFKQVANIDMTGVKVHISEDTNNCFSGVYNGDGYVIKNVSFSGADYTAENGLFGTIKGVVMNVGVVDSSFSGTYVGGIARRVMDGGRLINSYSAATVQGSGRGTGICDYFTGNAPKLMNCVFIGTASGSAMVGSTYNASGITCSNLYYKSGSARANEVVAATAFSTGTATTVIDTLNDSRTQVASSCGVSADMLCEWVLKDGNPVLRSSNADANTYNVEYVLNGGVNAENNPMTYEEGVGTAALEAAKKDGYTFDGWYDAAVGGNKVTAISATATGDITLYARFIQNVVPSEPDPSEPDPSEPDPSEPDPSEPDGSESTDDSESTKNSGSLGLLDGLNGGCIGSVGENTACIVLALVAAVGILLIKRRKE